MVCGATRMDDDVTFEVDSAASTVAEVASKFDGADRMLAGAAGMLGGADRVLAGAGSMLAGADRMLAGAAGMLGGAARMLAGAAKMADGVASETKELLTWSSSLRPMESIKLLPEFKNSIFVITFHDVIAKVLFGISQPLTVTD